MVLNYGGRWESQSSAGSFSVRLSRCIRRLLCTCIWIDSLFFGPFYAVALYAYAKGRDFIRLPSIIWASVMMTNVTIILAEELWGMLGREDRPQMPWPGVSFQVPA